MNKKLIKQLKGVGFEYIRSKHLLWINIDGQSLFYNCTSGLLAEEFNASKPIKRLGTFFASPEIIAAIKEYMGVDLAPKKNKREEIEELKTEIKRLESDYDRLFDLYDKLAKDLRTVKDGHGIALEGLGEHLNSLNTRTGVLDDAIKSQNEAIEQNNKEAHMANDRLTLVVRDFKRLGFWEKEEVDKQAPEMQAKEKKGFKAGDSVVLKNAKALESYINVLNVAISDLLTCTIDEVVDCRYGAGFWVRIPNSINRFWFIESELEHAPKESPKQFAKIINEDVRYPLQKGQLVEVVSESNIGATVKRTDKNLSYFYKYSDLEFIKEVSAEPKEKALEFGGWAETLVDQNEIRKGTKVLLVDVRDEDSIGFTDGKNSTHYLTSEELKPL